MTLQEAIKSDRKYQPIGWDDEFYSFRTTEEWFSYFPYWDSGVTVEFVQADFEIEESKVEITESQFYAMYEEAARTWSVEKDHTFRDKLAELLGLK